MGHPSIKQSVTRRLVASLDGSRINLIPPTLSPKAGEESLSRAKPREWGTRSVSEIEKEGHPPRTGHLGGRQPTREPKDGH